MKGKIIVIFVLMLGLTGAAWAEHPHLPQVTSHGVANELVWVPTTIQINRDYDQRGRLQIRNDAKKSVILRLICQSPADLTCGFLATPKSPMPMTLRAGQRGEFTLLIHANRAKRRHNRVAVVAQVLNSDGQWQVANRIVVPIHIAPAPLKLKTQWIEPTTALGQARLSKILRITNEGLDIPDFSVTCSKGGRVQGSVLMGEGVLGGAIQFNPMLQGVVFKHQSSLEIEVSPRLTPRFLELGSSLYLHGHGQYVKVPYFVSVPQDQDVYASGLKHFTSLGSRGDFCVAQGTVQYVFPAMMPAPQQTDEGAFEAWVLVELRPQRILYQDKPVALQVYFNTHLLGQIIRRRLGGCFLFKVPFKAFSSPPSAGQRSLFDYVSLKFQNADQDMSAFSSTVSLYIKHDFQKQYLIAKSDDAIKQLVAQANALESDLKVIDNSWQMPADVHAGDQVDAVFGLFNAGDVSLAPGQLIARMGQKIIGQASYGVLEPLSKRDVKIQLTFPNDMSEDESVTVTVKSEASYSPSSTQRLR